MQAAKLRVEWWVASWLVPIAISPRSKLVNQEAADMDGRLLGCIAQADREAFAKLYDRYSPVIFSVIVRILNDAKEAEDVLQEVFVQIWEKASSYNRALGAPSNWLITMARHKAIDRLRSSQRRYRLIEKVMAEGQDFASASVADEFFSQEKATAIRLAVTSLPDEQRRAIEMVFFAGLTQNEISETLHEPLGTVKARIRRGMLKLRDSLRGHL